MCIKVPTAVPTPNALPTSLPTLVTQLSNLFAAALMLRVVASSFNSSSTSPSQPPRLVKLISQRTTLFSQTPRPSKSNAFTGSPTTYA